jgi:phage tail sheath protein FI
MTVTSYPGVYMEEIAGGARPIEAAGTSTAAFFGAADWGPIGEVTKIFSFDEFVANYGSFRDDGQYLAHAVYQFFKNGGRECYVGRVAQEYKTASITLFDRAAAHKDSLTLSAISPGARGNSLMAVISSAANAPNEFSLAVKDEVIDPNTGETQVVPLELFDSLSMDPDAPNFVEAVVNQSKYIRAKAEDNEANAIAGYSESGVITGTDGGTDFIASGQTKFRINMHGEGARLVDIADDMAGKDTKVLGDIADAIQATLSALKPLRAGGGLDDAYKNASVQVLTPDAAKPAERTLRITSGLAGIASSVEILPAPSLTETLTGALKLGVRSGGREVSGTADMRPMDTASGDCYFIGDDTVDATRVSRVVAGDDGKVPQQADYIEAFHWLDKIPDVSLIAVPGEGSPALADEGMAYCRNRPLSDCFYVADMPWFYDELSEAKSYRDQINTPNSYGAVYFPWLKMLDPTGRTAEPMLVPPSGFVAGMYAQIDSRRGVWKAPAGTEAALAGAVAAVTDLRDAEQGDLNKDPKSVCVIRKLPGAGLVLWGARTLSSDPEYKYVPVRRTAIMLRKSIYNGIQWAVFEGNDERLWSSLRLNIGSFMNGLFRSGAFQGSKASDAYFVRCGLGDTMTQGDIDRGQVIVLVGFAPLKPAEFVIIRIQQTVGQG